MFRRVLPIALGLILPVAGLLKIWGLIHTPANPTAGLVHSPRFVLSLAGTELTLGAALIAGLWPTRIRRVAILLFAAFACVALTEALHGAKSCGCFGAVHVSPWYTATFDFCAVVALVVCKPTPTDRDDNGLQQTHFTARIVLAASILPAGVATAAAWEARRPTVLVAQSDDLPSHSDPFGAAGSLVVLDPANWLGKPFLLASHIDAGSQLGTGRWVVLLVHHDCDVCVDAVPKYQSAASMIGEPRLAIIEMPPYGVEALPWSTGIGLLGKLDTSRDWFATTPIGVFLKDGVVQSAADGDHAATPNSAWR